MINNNEKKYELIKFEDREFSLDVIILSGYWVNTKKCVKNALSFFY